MTTITLNPARSRGLRSDDDYQDRPDPRASRPSYSSPIGEEEEPPAAPRRTVSRSESDYETRDRSNLACERGYAPRAVSAEIRL